MQRGTSNLCACADSTMLIDVNQASFCYPSSCSVNAVHQVSFQLTPGNRVLLIGHNGSGKSTLLSLIAGKRATKQGSIRVMGKDPFNETYMMKYITLIGPPWPAQAYFASTVARVTQTAQFVTRRNQFAQDLHLPLTAAIDKMSSGEKRRVQILHGLLQPAKVYLLDECSTDIDVAQRRTLLELIKQQCQSQNGCCIYATHILDHVQNWATHIMLFDKGEMKAFVAIDQLQTSIEAFALEAMQKTAVYLPFASPVVYTPLVCQPQNQQKQQQQKQQEQQQLHSARNYQQDKQVMIKSHSTHFFQTQTGQRLYWTKQPIIVDKITNEGTISKLSYSRQPVIQCSDLTYKHIFRHLRFTIYRGERVLLCGCNGSGKTTLLNMLGGKQFFDNSNSVLSVLGIACFSDMSLNALVAYGGDWWTSVPGGEVHVREILKLHDTRAHHLRDLLAVDLDWDVRQLSAGELKRVQLLFHLLHDKPIVLLDEATTDLDVDQRHSLLQFLFEESVQRGVTIIYSSHIFGGLSGWASTVMLLDRTQRNIYKMWRQFDGDVIDLNQLTNNLITLKSQEQY